MGEVSGELSGELSGCAGGIESDSRGIFSSDRGRLEIAGGAEFRPELSQNFSQLYKTQSPRTSKKPDSQGIRGRFSDSHYSVTPTGFPNLSEGSRDYVSLHTLPVFSRPSGLPCRLETSLYIKVWSQGQAEALQQIEDKGYARPFEGDKRTLFRIGVNFSTATKLIEWVTG